MPITSSFNGASARALGFTSAGYTAIGNGYWISKTTKSGYAVSGIEHSMDTDSSGNLYYCGYSNATPSGTDYFQNIVKFSSSGEIAWQRKLDLGTTGEVGYAVAVDSSGNVYACGYGDGPRGTYSKYNSSGTIQYQKRLVDAFVWMIIYDCKVDSSGNLYLAGQTYNNTTNNYDGIVVKLDSSGAITWQRRVYSNNNDSLQGLTVDSSGNVYVCGYSVTATSPSVQRKSIIVKYNSSGTLQWQRQLTSSYDSWSSTIIVDGTGAPCVATYYNDSNGATSIGSLVKYDSSGTLQWQKKITYNAYGVSNTQVVSKSLAVDSSNNIYLISPSASNVGSLGTPTLIQKFNSSGTEQWARNFNVNNVNNVSLGGASISIVGSDMYISNPFAVASSDTYFIAAKLPTDGTKCGYYQVGTTNITYNTVTTTVTSGTLVDASGSMNDAAGALTSSAASMNESANDLVTTVRD
jgi:hypothetical protein